ncbi:MAG: ABC transporter permease [Anaerolineaceae bacterium]|nr:ABC transporter permease [Chloroflexota bacterium]MCY4008565.1 ABC transporter permease [Anaerolineaceae bacterium]
MTKFIVRRLSWMILVLLVVSIITFIFMHAVPGGPFTLERPLPPATLEQLQIRYGLHLSLPEQYINYMTNLIVPVVTRGRLDPASRSDYLINFPLPFSDELVFRWMDFGPSYKSTTRTVNDIFRENLPLSAQLGLQASIFAIALGLPLGVIAALRRNTFYDYFGMGIAIFGVSIPVIISAPILQYVIGVQLGWLPLSGWGKPSQMILPVITLGFSQSAVIARVTRASMLQVLNEDFVRTAHAKGLRERQVVVGHVLKNALIPVVTVIGPMLAFLITGSFIVETIFAIPGMGRFFVVSLFGRDYSVIMGSILLLAALVVLANTLVDVAYAWLDPRIRYY